MFSAAQLWLSVGLPGMVDEKKIKDRTSDIKYYTTEFVSDFCYVLNHN